MAAQSQLRTNTLSWICNALWAALLFPISREQPRETQVDCAYPSRDALSTETS